MISQGWKNQRRPEEEAPLVIKRVSASPSKGAAGNWMDSMLGQGSSRTVDSAVGRFRRIREAEAPAAPAPKKVMRLQAVGSEPAQALKPKGYLRLALASMVLLGVVAKFKPWKAVASMPLPELVRVEKAAEPEPKSALIDAGGSAVALWRSETGKWFGVNSRAELSRLSDAEAESQLRLPRIEAGTHAIERHGGHVLALNADLAQLNELLPLRTDLAAEVDLVRISGRSVKLLVHGGSVADLGEDGFQKKQARLAAVLADLQARRKRASLVDLRFENTAVVRLAGR